MSKKLLKENSVVQIGKYEANIIKSPAGWYLFVYADKENSILFSQFGINKEDLINKFNLSDEGLFPYCNTLKKLTEVIEYLQSLSITEDNGVFNKFPIGSIVVSLETISNCRKKGDIFKVLEKSSATKLYYKNDTHSSNNKKITWRKATKKEQEAYKNGIKNIKEIEYELVSLNPETDYFIVNCEKEYYELSYILKTKGYNVFQNFICVSNNWKYVTYNHFGKSWILNGELSSSHNRQISLDLSKILEEKKETNNIQVNSKPTNKLTFNHKNKKRSKIKLSTL